MGRIDVPVKRRQGVMHVFNAEILPHFQPGGKQVFIRNKISDILLNAGYRFLILFGQFREVFIRPIIFLQVFHFLLGKELIENKPQNVILVFIRLNLRTHLIGRFPDFCGQLLLIHSAPRCILYLNKNAHSRCKPIVLIIPCTGDW